MGLAIIAEPDKEKGGYGQSFNLAAIPLRVSAPKEPLPTKAVRELGRTGVLRSSDGIPLFEPNPDMHPFLARGIVTDHGEYHRMWTYDGIVSGVYTVIRTEILRGDWHFNIHDKPTGEEEKALKILEWVFGMDDKGGTIQGGLRGIIKHACLMLIYGFSLLETVWGDKVLNGATYRVPIRAKWRAPWSLYRWIYNRDDLIAVTQSVQSTFDNRFSLGKDSGRSEVVIPLDKCLLFQHMATDGNPEGRSLFRSCYLYYRAKLDTLRRDQAAQDRLFEGIFIVKEMGDKDGPFKSISKLDATRIKDMLVALREGRTNRIVVPYGVELVIDWPTFDMPSRLEEYKYFDHQIMTCAAATILGLDASAAASRGLSDGLGAIAYHVIQGFADDMLDVLNGDGNIYTGLIKRIVDVNIPNFKGRYPRLLADGIEFQDLEKLTKTLREAVQFLLVTPDEQDEQDYRRMLGLRVHSLEKIKTARDKVASRHGQSQQGDQRPQNAPLKPGEATPNETKPKSKSE